MEMNLKAKLRCGDLCLGSWITLGHSAIAEIFARAGFDWVVVDMEHSTISTEQAGELIRTIDLAGSVPLVRLTSNDINQIKRMMDAGAHGIVVPNVNKAGDAIDAVTATRYTPHGRRGVGLARAQQYGPGFKDYLYWQQDGPTVIVQIEHRSALDHLEAILTTPGVDGFMIGPYDLSCSMGIPGEFESPEFVAAMRRILQVGLQVGCPAGIHIVEPDIKRLRQAIVEGYRFIAYSVDIRMLDVSARSGICHTKD
ncbi:MAG: 2,4-dihydroxyhept-2-ene-1,7-dioic acid aldolase [Magnetococcales bacterium]|nr:2,4-dihydroxyhept-2-ene-1,7-dioic acid aldolase [Magnetococcales bacterium]